MIDKLRYTYDSATHASSINHLTYDVMKGGETETTNGDNNSIFSKRTSINRYSKIGSVVRSGIEAH
jgi:hypothetical protein